jgi:hypothetical protein
VKNETAQNVTLPAKNESLPLKNETTSDNKT